MRARVRVRVRVRVHWVRLRVRVHWVRVRVGVSGQGASGDHLLPLGARTHGAIEREAAWDQPVRVVADLVRVRARATFWGPRALISPRGWFGLGWPTMKPLLHDSSAGIARSTCLVLGVGLRGGLGLGGVEGLGLGLG